MLPARATGENEPVSTTRTNVPRACSKSMTRRFYADLSSQGMGQYQPGNQERAGVPDPEHSGRDRTASRPWTKHMPNGTLRARRMNESMNESLPLDEMVDGA